jgi:hypothetical protein
VFKDLGMLPTVARVGRIFVLALVPILTPALGAPPIDGAALPRSDRLGMTDVERQIVRTITIEQRTAGTSILTRVPVKQQ